MNKPKSDLESNTEGWKAINWRQAERYVFKLQKRIFKASQRGDVKAVRRLQKTLMRSWSAKCIAVRRVSQDNQETFRMLLILQVYWECNSGREFSRQPLILALLGLPVYQPNFTG